MNVVKILVMQAVPGMVVAADVYSKDSHLVISKGTTLTDKTITRLAFYSIADLSVYYIPEVSGIKKELEEETYYQRIKKSESFQRFQKAYNNAQNDLKRSLDTLLADHKTLDTDQLLSDASKILYQCESNIELFNMLHCMRNYDDTTYVHSLNVGLICNIIGKWLNFSPEDLEAITLSGLLHDIGKLMIPNDIITKPAKLTDEEFSTIKTHTIRGYTLLKSMKIDTRIRNSALMHHERCDGSGYPYGFYNEQIDPFAKLVAIADVYDAMTCARVYRGPLCPFEVISIFETEGYSKYDPRYIMTFMAGIVQTYINNSVKLNNGQVGQIVMINKMELARPVIRMNEDFIDLTKHRDLQIVALV